jgi:hypothetical protein
MPEIENSTLKSECKRLCDVTEWETQQWTADQMAIAVLRTVLTELGCKDELSAENAEARKEIAKIIKPCFTAPINFQREYLSKTKVDSKPLAPEVKKKVASTAIELA